MTGFQDNAKIKADVATARTIAGAVSIAEAEGTLVVDPVGEPDISELVGADYLAATPVSAQVKNGAFTIEYDGKWNVKTIKVPAGATAVTVYPAPTN